jgi:hypothetical protein
MEKCLNKLFLIVLLIFFSCGNTTKLKRENPYQEYINKINYLGRHRTGSIILVNEKRFKADKIEIINDSLVCIRPETQIENSYSIREVEKISFKDRFVGSVYGLLIGCSVGLSLAGGSTEPFPVQNVLIIGGLAGAIPGYLIGSDLNFVFVDINK